MRFPKIFKEPDSLPEKSVPPSFEEVDKQAERDFSNTKNLAEVWDVLAKQNGIVSESGKNYSMNELETILTKVAQEPTHIQSVTKTEGLRSNVARIVMKNCKTIDELWFVMKEIDTIKVFGNGEMSGEQAVEEINRILSGNLNQNEEAVLTDPQTGKLRSPLLLLTRENELRGTVDKLHQLNN